MPEGRGIRRDERDGRSGETKKAWSIGHRARGRCRITDFAVRRKQQAEDREDVGG